MTIISQTSQKSSQKRFLHHLDQMVTHCPQWGHPEVTPMSPQIF